MPQPARLRFIALVALTAHTSALVSANNLALPSPGDHALRVLSPTVLELSVVTQLGAPSQPLDGVVGDHFTPHLPLSDTIAVSADGSRLPIMSVGFKRRALYAPLRQADVRVGNWLYLELARPLPANAQVELTQASSTEREGGRSRVGSPGDDGAWPSNLAAAPGAEASVPSPPGDRAATSDGERTPEALWPAEWKLTTRVDPLRESPVIHVNQVGYVPSFSKIALVGYYLGSLGELALPDDAREFILVDASTHREVLRGPLRRRADQGNSIAPPPYGEVFSADFSAVTTPGDYRLKIDGLGVSPAFRIHDGAALAVARTYALGLYHQRCGAPNELPFTRHTHPACHTAPAEVPATAAEFAFTWKLIGELAAEQRPDASKPPHPFTADEKSQLYPFVRRGPIDVSGGHHDAGDYSKYTTNSAALVHTLVFAVDTLPRLAELDNLGLPESGDGVPDLLQEAKWEADFLAKLQDEDGGFYFLVYPRDRRYESDVLPDAGDRQVVWPKNTAGTAAAVAALAQCAASPTFRRHYPDEAARYLAQARSGWDFLRRALEGAPSPLRSAGLGADGAASSTASAANTSTGLFATSSNGSLRTTSMAPGIGPAETSHAALAAYQRLTHYGDNFAHDDELAWAACELFLATGDPDFQRELRARMPDPSSPALRRWGWWRLSESWGNAMRSYAFGARSGRVALGKLDARLLRLCEEEILAAADDALTRSEASAYGTSFPLETKRTRGGGWYFSLDGAMDLAIGAQLLATRAGFSDIGACLRATDAERSHNSPESAAAARGLQPHLRAYLAALVANLDFECGTNPQNVTFLTGLGRRRQREVVHQYAQNDRRALPPSGIPIGNIQAGLPYHVASQLPLRRLSFPDDGAATAPYPLYDRWSDVHNVSTEFVITNQARGLVSAACLATLTPALGQPWRGAVARIELSTENPQPGEPVTARLKINGPHPGRGASGPETTGAAEVSRRNSSQSGRAPAAMRLEDADIIWEARDHEPQRGDAFAFTPRQGGSQWIEAEALWPDGRRVFAAREFRSTAPQTTWVDDGFPAGAQPHAAAVRWITAAPAPRSGTKAHTSVATATTGAPGIHEHGFDQASEPLEVGENDVLFAYVWLDPTHPPREIMLAWNDGSWEHRAYWGANVITHGADGGVGRRRIGELPQLGEWVQLEVPAAQVGLAARKVRGMSFSAVDGRVVWDLSGVRMR